MYSVNMFSKLVPMLYYKKWEIKLCISVNIYPRLPKPGMSTHVFKISLCYVMGISVNIYHSVLMFSKLNYSIIKNGK